ncbi:UNVERIFIED_CONTAM: hypothetical protein Sradi_7237400 [Sesamum radiatum]|uniref:Uncharacterized protein n=1 Tax=Sesamum radiatum TaxID=300843 RepID=A0AAW2IMJ2_SESRA
MSCFRLLKTLLKEFQPLAVDFFWYDGNRRRTYWIAWDKLCSSKLKGGLGFRNLEAFNLVLLAKQLWSILISPKCLVSKVLKAKYFLVTISLKLRWGHDHLTLGEVLIWQGTSYARVVDGLG